MLLYLDAHHTFPHRLRCVLLILFHIYFAFMLQNIPSIICHMLTYILHANYDTQSSYKTVELLCTKKREEYTQLCSKFRLYSSFSPRLRLISSYIAQNGSKLAP